MRQKRDLVSLAPELLAEIVRRLGGCHAVARRLGLSRNAAQKWIERGQIPRARLEMLREMLRQAGNMENGSDR